MEHMIIGLTKEQIEDVIQLFNPYMDDYLYILDLKNDYYRISAHAAERFNLPSDAFYNAFASHQLFVYKEDLPLLNADFDAMLNGKKKSHNLHYRWLDKNGTPIWINCRGRVLYDGNGKPAYLIGCINETGNKQRADNISGLLGESELAAHITSFKDKTATGFLMRIGIDDFSSINAAFDIAYGNYIIKSVAKCINEYLTEKEWLFHITADEYMIVDFSGRTAEDAVLLYQRIQKRISAFIDEEHYKSVFTISAGIIDTRLLSSDYEDYLKLSDFCLKCAKNYGKNSCYTFSPDDYAHFLRKRKITTALYHAVANHFEGFEAYYQPIVDCKTGSLLGAEVLMRFSIPSPSGTGCERVFPDEFIPILEETGLILPAGKWILQEAVNMCSEMQKRIPDFTINVNISYVQVMKSNVLNDILSVLKHSELAPDCIGIELTESGYLGNNPHFIHLQEGLKQNGIKLILDDFGTGYSNLHCLSEICPSYIKIDRDFTNKAMANSYDYELVVKIIEMAHLLGLKICIEGVEEQEVLTAFRNLNADYIQGYLFGRPYPKSEFYEKFIC